MDAFIVKSDFKSLDVTGTTSSSADTSALFRHSLNMVPWQWLILEGDVYIPKDGVGPNVMDVRSRLTSQSFKIRLFY